YLMYMREGKRDEAETYRLLILSNFADSPIGAALQNPDYIDNLRNMDSEVQRLYEATYEAYLANDNATVHRAYETMTEKYPMSKVMPKFMFLNALAYVTEHRTDDFNSTLRELLERYPETDITPIASAWLKGMAQGRQIHSGATNMRGMIWDQRLGNDSTAVAEGEAAFTLKPDTKQLLVMTFAIDQVSSNALLYEIARHNFKSFVVKAYELEQLNFGRLGMIVISTFDNMDEVDHYCRVMAASSDFKLPVGVRPIVISDENFKILLNQGRSFDEYFRFLQEQNYESTQEQLLQPEEVETLDEADTAPAPQPEVAEPQAETPAPAPTPASAVQPTPAPTPTPAPVIVPTPTRPAMPTYDPGSEGDDPLLE
ncbi:MAG: tol-pal system YbgF family protein, partial [Muribaculaceae bacterium]